MIVGRELTGVVYLRIETSGQLLALVNSLMNLRVS
jgi:hypothetical protein